MNRMGMVVAVAAALAGASSVAAAQQPATQPARRPRQAQPVAPQAERLVVYKSPT